jgi:uncharacterized membrane protein
MENNIHKDGKLAAIITHLTFLGPVIAWFINSEEQDPFGAFYIRQSLGLVSLYFLLAVLVALIPNVYAFYGFNVFMFILWIYSFSGAVSNEYKTLPVVGAFFQKFFKRK